MVCGATVGLIDDSIDMLSLLAQMGSCAVLEACMGGTNKGRQHMDMEAAVCVHAVIKNQGPGSLTRDH